MLENAKMPDFQAPCLRIWHQFDMSHFTGSGEKIGFPIFELDTLPSKKNIIFPVWIKSLFVASGQKHNHRKRYQGRHSRNTSWCR